MQLRPDDPILRLNRVRKAFGPIVAVDDLTLEIRRGEVFGLLGPNGAGKTTTINMAVGLLVPDSGTVELDGDSPARPQVRRSIGVAPQALAIYEDLSGEDNVAFFGRMYGLFGRKLAERVAWSLDFVGVSERRRDRAATYSGGMKRRLNLAMALVHDPMLLLLDEPTVGVDTQSRNAIFDNILALHKEGRTILYTTHYMEEAQRLCDRVAILDYGKLLALDTVQGLIAAYGGKSVVTAVRADGEFRVETNDPVGEITRLQEGGKLLHVSLDGPDLEVVFLNLTGRRLRDQ